jgi:hypothetical protein
VVFGGFKVGIRGLEVGVASSGKSWTLKGAGYSC